MELQLFALNGTLELGRSISRNLEIPLGKMELREFEDGEHKIRPLENVRNRHIFVLASLYSDSELSVNDKLIRLLFFISALKDASAKEITAVIPYFPYARKDKKTKNRDPLSFKYASRLLEASGVDRVVALDIHNESAYQNAFKIPTEHLEASILFAPHILRMTQGEKIVLVSPDTGGFKRVLKYKEVLAKFYDYDISVAFIHKTRSEGILQTFGIVGDVKDKTAVMVDDIISSGSTMALGIETIKKFGAKKVIACVTHANMRRESLAILKELDVTHLLVSNSINLPSEILKEMAQKISIIDVADLLARVMKRVAGGDSVVELQESYPELYLSMSMQA